MTAITIPGETFDQLREALEKLLRQHNSLLADCDKLSGDAVTQARDAISAAKAVQPQAQEVIEQAYERGWVECARWAKRNDLCADVDSPAYIADRAPHLEAISAAKAVQPQAQGEVSWNLKYADSTPKLNVGHSAFEDWFQQQPFATQIGVKQMCRDAYAAGMGDPLVTYAHPQASDPAGWKLVPVEPTPQMVDAGQDVEDLYRRGTPDTWGKVYKAMLAAAPQMPRQ